MPKLSFFRDRLAGGSRPESVLNIFVPDPIQGKVLVVKTVESLPDSIFHIEWHNGVDHFCCRFHKESKKRKKNHRLYIGNFSKLGTRNK